MRPDKKWLDRKKTYEFLVKEYNSRVRHYNKGIQSGRWEASNPEDRDRHGHEVGALKVLAWALESLFPEVEQNPKQVGKRK